MLAAAAWLVGTDFRRVVASGLSADVHAVRRAVRSSRLQTAVGY